MNLEQLISQIFTKKTYLCVGLDADEKKLPAHLQGKPHAVLNFNKAIINATKDYCVSYKINTAFYETYGAKGWDIMQQTFDYIPATHFKIADAKRGDIGNTSSQYARAFFETMNADAVTVAPYMGADSVKPFLEFKDKFTIVLGLTSNDGNKDFQLLKLENGKTLYEEVITKVANWATPENLMFVAGATNTYQLQGVGFQGGSLYDVSTKAINKNCGLLVNASRAVIYASEGEDYEAAATEIAKQYANEMEGYLNDL
jgi:orotidine-5'-phosphate decarboxylase